MFILKAIYAFFVDTIQTILLASAIFLVIYLFLFRPFQVSGESMFPTFKNKEYILTNIISLRLEPISRGDVIVFRAPIDHDKDFIKRIIGLPGETVTVKNGFVAINGIRLDESRYLQESIKTHGRTYIHENETIKVKSDEYIVLGDNRPYSSDSRDWGPIQKNEIIGKSLLVYWPLSNTRIVKNPF